MFTWETEGGMLCKPDGVFLAEMERPEEDKSKCQPHDHSHDGQAKTVTAFPLPEKNT